LPPTGDVEARNWLTHEWSPWVSLDPTDGDLAAAPTDPGCYRVRYPDYEGLVYIGETGRSTRGRIQSLANGTYADSMPYSDPHTAAPCLWAIHDHDGPGFEVAWTTPPETRTTRSRKGLEAALIAAHRRTLGSSPTANFGGMIDGYRKSSQRSGGDRGGRLPDGESTWRSDVGAAPLDWTDWTSPSASTWMGLDWGSPEPLADAYQQIPTAPGLYRIWDAETAPPLRYVGQSATLRDRLYRHRRNRPGDLRFSYATLPADRFDAGHRRREVETDCIGVHFLASEASPTDQF
jgi:hypothetical protein